MNTLDNLKARYGTNMKFIDLIESDQLRGMSIEWYYPTIVKYGDSKFYKTRGSFIPVGDTYTVKNVFFLEFKPDRSYKDPLSNAYNQFPEDGFIAAIAISAQRSTPEEMHLLYVVDVKNVTFDISSQIWKNEKDEVVQIQLLEILSVELNDIPNLIKGFDMNRKEIFDIIRRDF